MFAQLGSIRFERLRLFESFDSSYGQEYAKHALIDGKPRIQRVGAKLDEHQISIRLHEAFCIPAEEINKIKSACDSGEILPFITGAGEVLGNFVIEAYTVNRQEADPQGNISQAVVSFNLLEHVAPDPLAAAREKAKGDAFANTAKQPQLIEPLSLIPAKMEPAAFMADVNTTKIEAYKVDAQLKAADSNPVKRAAALDTAAKSLTKMDQALSSLSKIMQGAQNAKLQQQQLKDQVNSLKTTAGNLKALVMAGSLSDALTANAQLQGNIKVFSSMSAPIAALTAQRSV